MTNLAFQNQTSSTICEISSGMETGPLYAKKAQCLSFVPLHNTFPLAKRTCFL